MEPGVPFALLGAVVLLAVAAWSVLAAAGLALAGTPARRTAAALLAAGAVVLVVVEALTATSFGRAASDDLLVGRAAGLLLVAAGLYSGALARRAPADGPLVASTPPVAGVVVPLGAAPGPAVLAAAAALLAAVTALRWRRDAGNVVVAVGLLVAGAAAAAAPVADDSERGALLVLGLRGAAALLVLGGLLLLARTSLLAKVVAAILAGVLVMAIAAVGVVGTTVVRGFEREQAALVQDAATGRAQLLTRTLEELQAEAPLYADLCTRPAAQVQCDAALAQFTEDSDQNFVLLLPGQGEPRRLGGRAELSPSEALGLAGSDLVDRAVAGGPNAVRDTLAGPVRLLGAEPGLALVVVVPRERATPTAPAGSAVAYGVRIGERYVTDDFDAGGFGFSLLVDDTVVASNLSERDQEVISDIAASAGALAEAGSTVPAEGRQPTVHLLPLPGATGAPVGVLALSRSADQALSAQRDALRALLLTALVTTAVVAGLALALGRRTVEPVRRLTVAADRVAAGDLATSTGVRGKDEVGTLARAFDTMTGSLAQVTGDLREAATRLSTVLASMSDGLVATDAGGCVTSVNPAALAMLGHADPGAVVGRPVADVVDLRAPSGEPLAAALDAVVLRDEPGEVHAADGTVTPVRAALAPLDSGDGAPAGVVLVLRDTSREREVERMKTEFLSNVSHELRTPLTPISAYADMLASRPGLEPKQVTTFASTIHGEAVKMTRVVNLLVDVASIEAGRVDVQPRAVDAREVLDARLATWRERVPARAADLRRRVASGLPAVLVDPAWLAKVLDELIDNAVKHTPPGTPITLAAGRVDDAQQVRVSVRDAGPGLDVADRDRVFVSFEQKDGSATRRVGGLGLGLSFVRRVAEDAGWRLSVTTEPGKGADFSLDLPVAPAAAPSVTRRASRAGRRQAPVRDRVR
jgi:PAS domain S-box-containing protein